MINFSIPTVKQREKLWRNALKELVDFDKKDIKDIAKNYEISGGSIKNIIQFAWLKAMQNENKITLNDILMGIRKELNKDGKSFNKS